MTMYQAKQTQRSKDKIQMRSSSQRGGSNVVASEKPFIPVALLYLEYVASTQS